MAVGLGSANSGLAVGHGVVRRAGDDKDSSTIINEFPRGIELGMQVRLEVERQGVRSWAVIRGSRKEHRGLAVMAVESGPL